MFAFSTIKIPIITLSALELSCWLALHYLDQSREVGGCRNNHRHSIGVQEDSLRRQHALGAGSPSVAPHINGGLGENLETQLLPNYEAESQSASVGSQVLITAERGEEEKSESATLNVKVFFPDLLQETEQLQPQSD